MDGKERHALYRASVGPGWWPILDMVLPLMREIDPQCSFVVEEKSGLLNMEVISEKIFPYVKISAAKDAAAVSSRHCVCCGWPGKLRMDGDKHRTLCDSCYEADDKFRRNASASAEKRWLNSKKTILFFEPISGRSLGEHSLRYDMVADKECTCYMCEKPIHAGEEASLLILIDYMSHPSEMGDYYMYCRHCANTYTNDKQGWEWDGW